MNSAILTDRSMQAAGSGGIVSESMDTCLASQDSESAKSTSEAAAIAAAAAATLRPCNVQLYGRDVALPAVLGL